MFALAEPTETRDDGPSMAQLARMRGQILAAAARHGATNVRVFGSVARGEAGAAGDVDVVTEPGLKARIRQRVLAEAVPV